MGKSYQKAKPFSSCQAHYQLVQWLEIFREIPAIFIRFSQVEGWTSAFSDSASYYFDVVGRFQNKMERRGKGGRK